MYTSPETLADLTAVRDLYFSCLLWSSGLVAVGVILEGPEVIHEARGVFGRVKTEPRPWITLIALIGWIFVALGVVGEGISEALVSRADGNIQAFNDRRLADTTQEAGDAKTSAIQAASAAASAVGMSNDASSIANGARAVSKDARMQADLVKKDLSSAEKRLSAIHAYLTPRSLTQKDMEDLRHDFKLLANPVIPILVIGSWESGLGVQVWRSLKDAGFDKAQMEDRWNLPYGMSMSSPDEYWSVADKISIVLLKKWGIGPMLGGVQSAPTGAPIRIIIGDIRTAALTPLK